MNLSSWENKTILIVEDDEVSNEFFYEVLKPTKANLLFAKDGKSSIQIFRDNPHIDIILMDIQLPVMNGQQAAEEIRHLNKNVIIIAQTAYAMADDRQKYIAYGFDDYISKPIIPQELISLIGKFIH